MDIKAKKLDLIEWLIHLNDETTIEKVYNLKESKVLDWYDKLPEAAKASIEKGLKEAGEGKVTPHHQVMETMRAKYNIKK